MPAELGFDQVRRDQLTAETNFVEGGHHLTFLKFPQAAAFLTRWAGGVFLGELVELGALVELLDDLFGEFFMFDQNV